MDYKSITAPYLNNVTIGERVELFRKEFWNDNIPVEIEDIIELKLNIGIIPIPGFLKLTNMDALIASGWKYIYVDNKSKWCPSLPGYLASSTSNNCYP